MTIDELYNKYLETREKRKVKLYENDLKYKKQRGISDLSEYITDNPELSDYLEIDFDTLDYRFEDCKKKGRLILDLSNLELSNLDFLKKPEYKNIAQNIIFVSLSDNNLSGTLNLEFFKNLKVLDCSNNAINKIVNISNKVYEVVCKNNKFTTLDFINDLPGLQKLDCSNNLLVYLPAIQSLEILICNKNNLESVAPMNRLKKMVCKYNKITNISNFPVLELLECDNNMINTISNLPKLKFLWCPNNQIVNITGLDIVELIHCYKNCIKIFPYFKNLSEIMCDYNNVLKFSSNYCLTKENVEIDKYNVMYIKLDNM